MNPITTLQEWFTRPASQFAFPVDLSFGSPPIIPTAATPVGLNTTYPFQGSSFSKIAPGNFPTLQSIYPNSNRGPTF